MDFKPKFLKILISILAIIIWYIFLIFYLSSFNGTGVNLPCNEHKSINLLNPIEGGCTSEFSETIKLMIIQLIIIFIPGIIIYILWSLIEKNKKGNKK